MTFIRSLYGEYTFIVLVLIFGIGTTLMFAWQQQTKAEETALNEFSTAALDRLELITDKIEHNKVILRSISAFFRSSEDVDRREFKTFTQQLLRDYSYIEAIEWIPQVSGEERAEFEKKFGEQEFSIKEIGIDGTIIPSKQRDIYYPIYFIEPLDKNQRLLGLDVASDLERNEALARAAHTRQLAVTGSVNLLHSGEDNVPGVVFYEPVYKTGPLTQDMYPVSGFIGSIVPFKELIESALKPLTYSGINIIIHDLSAPYDGKKLLYVRSTRLKDISAEEILEDYQNPDTLVERNTIDVGGRKWQISMLSARGFFKTDIKLNTYLILVAGTVFTLLLVAYMFSRIRENERISKEVEQRTQELSKSKRETELILMSTREGITGLDAQGNISFCNLKACQILGYNKRELIGKNHHMLLHHKHPDGSAYNAADCPIQKILDYGYACNVRDEVFWKKSGEALQVEYTGSPIFEGGEINGAVLIFRDITERLELERKLEQMARYDQLTGLANRVLFLEHLKGAVTRASRTGKKVGVVYLDLNGFKPINDTLGHAAGDSLLMEFSSFLKTIVRDSDTVARMGGDEFTILADNLEDEEECLNLIKRLRKRLEQPFQIASENFTIGASIGLAFYPDHTSDFEELISYADTAMYQAKKNKNLPFVIYSPRS